MASDEDALSLIARYLDGKVDDEGFPLPPDVSNSLSSPFCFVMISFISNFIRSDTVCKSEHLTILIR